MSSYHDYTTEHVRLSILRVLEGDPDYQTNEHVLRVALNAVGHRLSADILRTEISWLAEQHLLTDKMVESTTVVTLTPRGQDVADGLTRVPGVARPLPGQS